MGTYVNIDNKSCESRQLFCDLRIAQSSSFEKHLNKYRVIYLDMTDFSLRFSDTEDVVDVIQQDLEEDLLQACCSRKSRHGKCRKV